MNTLASFWILKSRWFSLQGEDVSRQEESAEYGETLPEIALALATCNSRPFRKRQNFADGQNRQGCQKVVKRVSCRCRCVELRTRWSNWRPRKSCACRNSFWKIPCQESVQLTFSRKKVSCVVRMIGVTSESTNIRLLLRSVCQQLTMIQYGVYDEVPQVSTRF